MTFRGYLGMAGRNRRGRERRAKESQPETRESRINHRYNFLRQRYPMIPEDEAMMIAEGLEDHWRGNT